MYWQKFVQSLFQIGIEEIVMVHAYVPQHLLDLAEFLNSYGFLMRTMICNKKLFF